MRTLLPMLFLVLLAGCGEQAPMAILNSTSGAALGTTYNITYISGDELDYQQEIDSVFAAINASMSTYLPNSDISKINRGDATVVVDRMFQEVFELSQQVHSITGGYFDPTVGVLVNAWGFGPGEAIKMDSTKVDSLLQYVGFHKVSLTTDHRIQKENPNIVIDFNAIAKGYAIDRLAALLDQKGITDYLVEVGGELIAKGINRTKQKPWIVGIDDPQTKGERKLIITIKLKDRALASSGNYRKFRIDEASGLKYVHTIDPKTGFTKDSNVLGVTVIANDCARADAFATAFMAMDLEMSMRLLEQQSDLEAYIIYIDDRGEVQEFMTPGFKELVVA